MTRIVDNSAITPIFQAACDVCSEIPLRLTSLIFDTVNAQRRTVGEASAIIYATCCTNATPPQHIYVCHDEDQKASPAL